MIRFGRPFEAAMCQPSDVPIFGGLLPPTFVAKPFLKTRWRFTGSQSPQKPTYTFAPLIAAADAWFGASVLLPSRSGADSAAAFASPGWFFVPRSYTSFQSVSAGVHEVGSLGSGLHVVVSGPAVVSAMSRPAATM